MKHRPHSVITMPLDPNPTSAPGLAMLSASTSGRSANSVRSDSYSRARDGPGVDAATSIGMATESSTKGSTPARSGLEPTSPPINTSTETATATWQTTVTSRPNDSPRSGRLELCRERKAKSRLCLQIASPGRTVVAITTPVAAMTALNTSAPSREDHPSTWSGHVHRMARPQRSTTPSATAPALCPRGPTSRTSSSARRHRSIPRADWMATDRVATIRSSARSRTPHTRAAPAARKSAAIRRPSKVVRASCCPTAAGTRAAAHSPVQPGSATGGTHRRDPRPGPSTIPAIAQSPAASPTKVETRYLDERFKPTHSRSCSGIGGLRFDGCRDRT